MQKLKEGMSRYGVQYAGPVMHEVVIHHIGLDHRSLQRALKNLVLALIYETVWTNTKDD